MFNNDKISRSEAETYVEGVQQEIDGLKGRVSALESLAETMRRTLPSARLGAPVPAFAEVERDVTGTAVRRDLPQRTPGASLGVDYGAVAFGLSEIKAKVAQIVPEGRESDMANEYRDAVQYFADVFAKSDPTFDADAFKAQAGV